jgi:hypothetical protein
MHISVSMAVQVDFCVVSSCSNEMRIQKVEVIVDGHWPDTANCALDLNKIKNYTERIGRRPEQGTSKI